MKGQRPDPLATSTRPNPWRYTWLSAPGTPITPTERIEGAWPEIWAARVKRADPPLFPSTLRTRRDE